MPKISVVIPLYNKEQYIERTVNSVLSQSFNDFEAIIVDDGSTDSSKSIVEKLIDERFRIVSQSNSGVSAARNLGVEAARAEYVAFLDADDRWEKDFLDTIVNLIDRFPLAGMFATGYKILNSAEEVIFIKKIENRNGAEESFFFENYFYEACQALPPICSSSVCVKKESLVSVGMFPLGIRFGEDTAVWSRIAIKEKIAMSSKVLSNYYRFGLANNTEEKFVSLNYHFDYSSLLAFQKKNKGENEDLRRFVEICTLRKAALALRNGDVTAAKKLLARLPPKHYLSRHVILAIFCRFPYFSLPIIRFIHSARNRNKKG